MTATRTRWAALGAAVAVTLGAGSIGIATATSPSDAVAFVPITPCRLLDTRPGSDNVGPRSAPLAADDTHTVDAVAANDAAGDCAGLIPTTAAALSMNVTAVGASEPTFLTIWEADLPRPLASSLNPSPGQPPTPNAVTTDLNADGEFSIYNLAGTVHVLADVNGYYTDHHHDDRYYTEAEVDAQLDLKAASADVYTRQQVDSLTGDQRVIAASASASNAPDLPSGNVQTTVLSASLEVPTAGLLQISGTFGTASATRETMLCSFRLDSALIFGSSMIAREATSCGTTGAISVEAGSYDVQLRGNSPNDVSLGNATLNVLFIPDASPSGP